MLFHPSPPALHDVWRLWTWEPAVLVGLAVAAWAYTRGTRLLWRRAGAAHGVGRVRPACFAAGLITLFVALVSPLAELGHTLLSAHMAQHLLLILVAPPLLVLGRPEVAFTLALPKRAQRAAGSWMAEARLPHAALGQLSRPALVWVLHAATLWIWHLPRLYQAAVLDDAIHGLEHLTMLATALLYWWTIIRFGQPRGLRYGAGVLYVFTMGMQSTALGALMTLSPSPWYPDYAASATAWGVAPLDDQQVAGALMWVPPGLVYLGVASWLCLAWLGAVEKEMQRRERREIVRPVVEDTGGPANG